MASAAPTLSDRVLIVGATGFVGKRLIPKLVKRDIRLRLRVYSYDFGLMMTGGAAAIKELRS